MSERMIVPADWHYGRQWSGHLIEDECPCTQAPCGLVAGFLVATDCPQHAPKAAKTMRQGHEAEKCPVKA